MLTLQYQYANLKAVFLVTSVRCQEGENRSQMEGWVSTPLGEKTTVLYLNPKAIKNKESSSESAFIYCGKTSESVYALIL